MPKKPRVPFSELSRDEIDKFRMAYVRSVLRNASLKWPARYMALRRASVGWNQKRCAICRRCFPQRLSKLDHTHPVVDPTQGFVGWDTFIFRLFTYSDGWQVLCPKCHSDKTAEERKIAVERRRIEREKNPKPKKPRKAPIKKSETPPAQ